ncbi:radical SAM protein [candidate division KSB1 bacterium]|nr:radical SAM protein [candidate division KSB1 bacterium]
MKYHYFTKFTPTFPQIIQVQTQYGCNARCVFCPMGREDNQIIGHMEDATFEKIVTEAVSNGVKVLSPYLQNDPLVDRKMHERIEVIRAIRGKKPFPKTKIITNGGLLTEERAYNLINAGLEYIVFSVHGVDKAIYDNIMQGPKFETVVKNIETLLKIKDELKAKNPQIEIWAVLTKEVEAQLDATKVFWKARGIRFKARQLDNRANPDIIDTSDMASEDVDWKFAHYCTIPFWRAWILWNGDMVLCCVDWERTQVFGNIHEKSIKEIWNGEGYRKYRQRMMDRDLAGTICENCQGT